MYVGVTSIFNHITDLLLFTTIVMRNELNQKHNTMLSQYSPCKSIIIRYFSLNNQWGENERGRVSRKQDEKSDWTDTDADVAMDEYEQITFIGLYGFLWIRNTNKIIWNVPFFLQQRDDIIKKEQTFPNIIYHCQMHVCVQEQQKTLERS